MGIKEKVVTFTTNARIAANAQFRTMTTKGIALISDPNVRREVRMLAWDIAEATVNRLTDTPPVPKGSPLKEKIGRVTQTTIAAAGNVFDTRVDTYLSNIQTKKSSR